MENLYSSVDLVGFEYFTVKKISTGQNLYSKTKRLHIGEYSVIILVVIVLILLICVICAKISFKKTPQAFPNSQAKAVVTLKTN